MNPGLYGNLSQRFSVTPEQTVLSANQNLTVAHNLPDTPKFVRWVLVCKKAELGCFPGDEVDLLVNRDTGGGGSHFTLGANRTNVFLASNAAGSIQIVNVATNGLSTITAANWRFKAYCWA